jgi:hypothetical protein
MATTHSLLIIERILRDREGVWEQIGDERDLGRLIRDLLLSSTVALFCFGAVLGAFNTDNALLQALLSALKLPLLFLVTLAICLPTLYLFNLVFGARLQVRQALALVMVAITVISMLAVAFAPISLFFLVTANQYSFYKLLNVAILTLAAVVGLRFLTGGMAALNKHNAVRDAAARAAAEAAAQARAATAVSEATPVGAPPALEAPKGDGATAEPATGAAPVSPAPGAAPVSPAPGAAPVSPAPGAAGPVVPVSPPVQPALPVPVPAGAPHGNGGGVLVATHPAQFAGVRMGVAAQPVPASWSPRPQVPPAEKQASMTLLYVWILLFGFVGTQLAWTLRPFFGSPGQDFELFRSIDGNFYVDIVRTIGGVF